MSGRENSWNMVGVTTATEAHNILCSSVSPAIEVYVRIIMIEQLMSSDKELLIRLSRGHLQYHTKLPCSEVSENCIKTLK